MKTCQEIRLENLRLLIEEAGSAAALARLTSVPPPYISQLLAGATNQEDRGGKARVVGDDTARKLERGMGREAGWLDHEHPADAQMAIEAEVLQMLRQLTEESDLRAAINAVRGIFNGRASTAVRTATEKPGLSALRSGVKRITPLTPGAKKDVGKKRGNDAL